MNDGKETKKGYGFIKPTTEQLVYVLALVAATVFISIPAVRNMLWFQISASQWIITAFAFVLPIVSMVRMIQSQKKHRKDNRE